MADADTKILYYGNKNMREQLTDLFVDANVWACTGFEILLQALDVSLPYIWTSIIFKIPSSNMGLCLHWVSCRATLGLSLLPDSQIDLFDFLYLKRNSLLQLKEGTFIGSANHKIVFKWTMAYNGLCGENIYQSYIYRCMKQWAYDTSSSDPHFQASTNVVRLCLKKLYSHNSFEWK